MLIAIADSIDAMLSNRPYRKGMDTDFCREQIEKTSGIMYDPQIVPYVIKNWDDLLAARNRAAYVCNFIPPKMD